MQVLLSINDSDLGLDSEKLSVYEKEIKASRAIVLDKEGKVALLHARHKGYHKLPGGGVETGEDIHAALEREVIEEIGCKIENFQEVGIVEEYRNRFSLHQISYCFLVELVGEKGTPQLTEDEIKDGFEPIWVSLKEAINILEGEKSIEHYEGKFINLRDLFLLKEAQKLLEIEQG